MYSIEELQERKLLPATLKTLDSVEGTISIDECKDDLIPEKPVVVKDVVWLATNDGKPVTETTKIYSANNECVGVYNCNKHSFNIMKLSGDYLITKKSIYFKEGQSIMADLTKAW